MYNETFEYIKRRYPETVRSQKDRLPTTLSNDDWRKEGRVRRHKWQRAGPEWPISRENCTLPNKNWKKRTRTADHCKVNTTDSQRRPILSSRSSKYMKESQTSQR
eukprot:scaffold15250_cov143-Cylindrotheca_fusiformis.AAC.1